MTTEQLLQQMRERESIAFENLRRVQATSFTLIKQILTKQKETYDLRCSLADIAELCGISRASTLPYMIVDEVIRLNDRRKKLAKAASILWDEHKQYSMSAHGVEGCDDSGNDSEAHEMMQSLVDETLTDGTPAIRRAATPNEKTAKAGK